MSPGPDLYANFKYFRSILPPFNQMYCWGINSLVIAFVVKLNVFSKPPWSLLAISVKKYVSFMKVSVSIRSHEQRLTP